MITCSMGKGWEDILGNESLKKLTIKEAPENKPSNGDLVTIIYDEALHGNKLEQQDNELTFVIGDGDVFPIFELVVKLMNLNEISEFISAPRFAYGKSGNLPHIPPDSTVHFRIILKDIKPSPDYNLMELEEIYNYSKSKKDKGNFWYVERQDFPSAINSYLKAAQILDYYNKKLHIQNVINYDEIDVMDTNYVLVKPYIDLYTDVYNNLALSQLKMEAYEACLKSLNEVFRYKPRDLKALYRQSQALVGQGDTENALRILNLILDADPNNKVVIKESKVLQKRITDNREADKEIYRKMMSDYKSSLSTFQLNNDTTNNNTQRKYGEKISDLADKLYFYLKDEIFTTHLLTVVWFAFLSLVLALVGLKYNQWTMPPLFNERPPTQSRP